MLHCLLAKRHFNNSHFSQTDVTMLLVRYVARSSAVMNYSLGDLLSQTAGRVPYPGGRLIYETDGDARPLAQGCKFWSLVSLRVFRAKCSHFKPPRSPLGFRKGTQLREEKQVKFSFFFFFSFLSCLF